MADESLVVHARLRDELSRPIRAVKEEVQQTTRAVRRLTAEGARAAGTRGIGALARQTTTLGRRLRGLRGTVSGLSTDLSRRLTSGLRTAGLALAAFTAGATLLGVNTASSFQTARVSLNRLVGGAQEGADLFKFLTDLDPIRPFDIQQLQQTATQLAAVNIVGDDLRRTLIGVTDVASATADPSGSLYAATRAISQMSSAGVILAEELNQLVDAGVNVGPALEKAFGMGVAEVRKANAGGGAQLAAQPFLDALFGNAAGAGEEIATQTFRGLLSGVKSRGMLRLTEAFNPLLGIMQAQLPALEGAFGDFVGVVAPALSALIGQMVPLLGGALRVLGPILGVVFTGLGRLLDAAAPAFALLEPVIDELGVALTELVTELVPVMPDLVRGFVLLVGLLPDFVRLLGALVPLVSPLVDLLDTLLGFGPTRVVILGVLAAILGFNAIAGPTTALWGFVAALRGLAGAQAAVAATGGAGLPGAAAGAGRLGMLGKGLGVAGGVIGGGSLMWSGAQGATDGAGIGDIGKGAAGGALLGGTLGSVVPGIGTAAGALVGGIAGGAGTALAGLFGRKSEAKPSPRQPAPATVDASMTMAPGAVVIDARGLSEQQLARMIPSEVERYQRDRAERGVRASRG